MSDDHPKHTLCVEIEYVDDLNPSTVHAIVASLVDGEGVVKVSALRACDPMVVHRDAKYPAPFESVEYGKETSAIDRTAV